MIVDGLKIDRTNLHSSPKLNPCPCCCTLTVHMASRLFNVLLDCSLFTVPILTYTSMGLLQITHGLAQKEVGSEYMHHWVIYLGLRIDPTAPADKVFVSEQVHYYYSLLKI